MPFSFLLSFFFFYIYGSGVGLLYEAGLMVVYIHVFVPQNHLDYPLYVQNMYILIKQYRPIMLFGAVKTTTFVTQRH